MSPIVVACDRIYLFGEGRWRVWIGERKETEVCDFEVAQESGRSSSRSEVEEVLIVIVDYEKAMVPKPVRCKSVMVGEPGC